MGITALLRKMGWQPGKLGRNGEGTLGFWEFEVELEKRGYLLEQHIKRKVEKLKKPIATVTKNLQGKHPVSILGEYCSKRRFDVPIYELCFESGKDHKKNFLFKVTVNEVEYKPSVSSSTKKMAKALAAQICLQALGILPKPDSKIVRKP